MFRITLLIVHFLATAFIVAGCKGVEGTPVESKPLPDIDYTVTADNTHNKFSSLVPPVLKVEDGAVIEVYTKEASDNQVKPGMTASEFAAMEDYDAGLVHPLTGPVYVEGAMPGDVLKVTLHLVETGDWGWTRIVNGIFLEEEFDPLLVTWELEAGQVSAEFLPGLVVDLEPFPGVVGVAPPDEEMLSTIPPRANGGNMDDRHMVAGTILYFPVFVEGALFSIGDMHAAQGAGEVCGTAIEVPGRIVYQVEVVKNGPALKEPHYETESTYAVTAFAATLDEAARKANSYMIDFLSELNGITRSEAFMLTSLAGDLRIAEVVDQNMLVSMHIPKSLLRGR